MIRIVKASAGSGKTFRLTEAYLGLILRSKDPQEYRHILAVTFTNKATGEMKSRILKELDRLSREPEQSPYCERFVPTVFPTPEMLASTARQRLGAILHDYSCFSVSTIDRFFQQTLKAFSREIGHFASYQVELDKPALVRESVDRILDSLTDDPEHRSLVDWLISSVRDGLSRGDRFNLDNQLHTMAVSLESESYRELIRRSGLDETALYSQEHLRTLIGACRDLIRTFNRDLAESAGAILSLMLERGVAVSDMGRSFHKVADLAETASGDSVDMPTDAFFAACADPKKWFSAAARARAIPAVGSDMEPLVSKLTALFREESRYKVYRTALLIRQQLFALGIAGEIRRSLNALQQEKNVLSLDDSNALLREIIDGSDAPFIYEKIGVRYRHFLLDEFQDTSMVQWNNFLPLLQESISHGGEDLVVGDVKQSIYRFRDSDWRLLDSEIGAAFPGGQSGTETLKSNRRTQPQIVRTCGEFFRFAADQLDRLHEGESGIIRRLYGDVVQVPMAKAASEDAGLIRATFCSDSEAEYAEIVRQVSAYAGDQPERFGEIAILVRGNSEGSEIAARLIAAGIPVISDDALYVKASVTVRRLVSELELMLGAEAMPGEARDGGKRSVSGYLAREMGFTPPQDYQSPLDLAESLLRDLRRYDPALFDAEIAYIEAFMDYLSEWGTRNGNDLAAFLAQWKDADPRISPPEEGHSVRVMTIHKSKGLEFPLVILPFVEKIVLYKADQRWCLPQVEGTPLDGLANGAYRVCLSAASTETLFSKDYNRELLMQLIDNLNILYVAMTRPKNALSLIAERPKEKFIETMKDGDTWSKHMNALREETIPKGDPLAAWNTMRDLLYGYITAGGAGFTAESPLDGEEGAERYRLGTAVEGSEDRKKEAPEAQPMQAPYPSFPLNDDADEAFDPEGNPLPCGERNRLKFNSGAADYFGEDGSVGVDASPRVRGTVLHEILSRVVAPEDIPQAVRRTVDKGSLPPSQEAETAALLSDAIASLESARASAWFPAPEEGCQVLNEASLITREGEIYRPDRVVIHPGGRVDIVDYKFGRPDGHELKGYLRQIGRYAALLRSMGYPSVSAALWYPLEAPGCGIIEGD